MRETQRFVIVGPGAMHVHVCLLAQLNPDSNFLFSVFLSPETIVLYLLMLGSTGDFCCVMWVEKKKQEKSLNVGKKIESINPKLDYWLARHVYEVWFVGRCFKCIVDQHSKVSDAFFGSLKSNFFFVTIPLASQLFFIALTTKRDAGPLHTCYEECTMLLCPRQ